MGNAVLCVREKWIAEVFSRTHTMCNWCGMGCVVLCVMKMWPVGVFLDTHTMCNWCGMGCVILCVTKIWLAGVFLDTHTMCDRCTTGCTMLCVTIIWPVGVLLHTHTMCNGSRTRARDDSWGLLRLQVQRQTPLPANTAIFAGTGPSRDTCTRTCRAKVSFAPVKRRGETAILAQNVV